MFKYGFLFIALSSSLNAEVIYLKDLTRQPLESMSKNQEKERHKVGSSDSSIELQKINSFFLEIGQKYPGIGPFNLLENHILMSKINQNIEKISPSITQFRPFTLFKMERMEAIFREIEIYLKDNYEQKKQEVPPRIEVEQENSRF